MSTTTMMLKKELTPQQLAMADSEYNKKKKDKLIQGC
ncbi:hypothetical protein JOD24_002169 [Kroppenstedtia sanguinis]